MNRIKENPFTSSLVAAIVLALVAAGLLTAGAGVFAVVLFVLAGIVFLVGPTALGYDADK